MNLMEPIFLSLFANIIRMYAIYRCRGSLRFEYVYDILSYLESRLNIKINYMTVSRYDMLTVGTLTKFFKESGREYFEKV